MCTVKHTPKPRPRRSRGECAPTTCGHFLISRYPFPGRWMMRMIFQGDMQRAISRRDLPLPFVFFSSTLRGPPACLPSRAGLHTDFPFRSAAVADTCSCSSLPPSLPPTTSCSRKWPDNNLPRCLCWRDGWLRTRVGNVGGPGGRRPHTTTTTLDMHTKVLCRG